GGDRGGSFGAAHRRPRGCELPARGADSATSAATVHRRAAHHVRNVLGGRGPGRGLARGRPRAPVVGRFVHRGRARVGARGVVLASGHATAPPRDGAADGGRVSMMLWNWTRKVVTWWVVTFVTGDDWSVAAAIGAGLLATWGLVRADVPAWWLMPLVVIGATVSSLYRAVLREG